MPAEPLVASSICRVWTHLAGFLQTAETLRQTAPRGLSCAWRKGDESSSPAVRLTTLGSIPVVDVFKPSDVVFLEVGARLNLNEQGGDLARVSEAVLLADGDVA